MKFFSLPLLVMIVILTGLLFTPAPAAEPIKDQTFAKGQRHNKVFLFRATPFEVRPGDTITLDGSGFSKSVNEVRFNGGYPTIASSTNGVLMDVVVPVALSNGEYRLSVSNSLNSSDRNNPDIKVLIRVTSSPRSAPVIKSASISDSTITIVGEGFTSSNSIYTTFGNLPNPVSSNGNTITFRLSDLPLYGQIKKASQAQGRSYNSFISIYVQNDRGMNKAPYNLGLSI